MFRHTVRSCQNQRGSSFKKVQTICKLLVVNPATITAGEGSLSSARRLKTWVRSRMGDERFSNLTVLNGHKQ